MERVHLGEVVQEQVGVQEWVDLVWEGRGDPERVQALGENACVQSAERLSLMKQEHHATL